MAEKAKRVTIKDVAEHCGLSKSLVAYLINGDGYRKSTPENRRKVEAAVKALNYRPNQAARQLSSGKAFTIGIAMPMSGTGFYGDIALELQRKIRKRGYESLFAFWAGDDPEELHEKPIQTLFTRNVDGVISWDATPRFQEMGIPAVVYNTPNEHYDDITPDDEWMIETALRHLTGFGHKSVGILSMKERNRIFARTVGKYQLTTKPEWIFELSSWGHHPLDAFGQFYQNCDGQLPNALLCHSGAEAIAAVSSAIRKGIRIPQNLSVISLDNSFVADFFQPALDAFDLQVEEIAEAMVSALLDRMRHPNKPIEQFKITPKLIHRESVIQSTAGEQRYDVQSQ